GVDLLLRGVILTDEAEAADQAPPACLDGHDWTVVLSHEQHRVRRTDRFLLTLHTYPAKCELGNCRICCQPVGNADAFAWTVGHTVDLKRVREPINSSWDEEFRPDTHAIIQCCLEGCGVVMTRIDIVDISVAAGTEVLGIYDLMSEEKMVPGFDK